MRKDGGFSSGGLGSTCTVRRIPARSRCPVGLRPVKIPLARKNLLEATDGLLKRPLDAVACCSLLLLTFALLMTPSHSEGCTS